MSNQIKADMNDRTDRDRLMTLLNNNGVIYDEILDAFGVEDADELYIDVIDDIMRIYANDDDVIELAPETYLFKVDDNKHVISINPITQEIVHVYKR